MEETRTKGNQDTVFGTRILIFFSQEKKNRKSIVPISITNAKLPFVNLETFRNASRIQLEEGELSAVCIEREDLINITQKKNQDNEVVNAECYRVHPAHH